MREDIILGLLVFYPFVGGLLAYVVGTKNETLRDRMVTFITGSEFAVMLGYAIYMASRSPIQPFAQFHVAEICGFGLGFTLDGFRSIYGMIVAFMWMMVTILSREYFMHDRKANRFYVSLLVTLGATMGIFLSADLYTTFLFFEIMSFASYIWVVQEEDQASIQAANTYLAVAVLGGLVMLMGVFLVYHELGTLVMEQLLAAAGKCQNKQMLYVAGGCLLFGFGVKAGAFPMHIWLPKAHSVAPSPASALLSGVLTKTGIFGILMLSSHLFLRDASWGMVIVGIGVLTMFGGALLAVFSVNLKRTLACSSMSQIGFILVGIGMQGMLGGKNAVAVYGSFLHMVNHSLIKLVLFMAAGVIVMNVHGTDLNEIRGFGRKKPLLKGCFLVGALAISGVPLFAGYISKTLLHESMIEYGKEGVMQLIEAVFLLTGGLTVAYMIKVFVAIFVEKNVDQVRQKKFDQTTKYMNQGSVVALTASAGILLIWGLFPHGLMERASEFAKEFMHLEEGGHEIMYFNLKNLSGALISIGIGVLIYEFVIRNVMMKPSGNERKVYVERWPAWLDLEMLIYRPVLLRFLPFVFGVLCRVLDSFMDSIVVLLRKSIYCDSPLPHEPVEGTGLTIAIGNGLNFLQSISNHTWRRKHPTCRDYVHIVAVKNEELKENNMIIQRSLSFGLFLFCIGFTLTLVYLIWW